MSGKYTIILLTLAHARGYGTRCVCQSVCQLPAIGTSSGHKSETTSSITTRRGIGMGSVGFSDIILLDEMRSPKNGVIFPNDCGENTVDLHVRTEVRTYQQVGNRAMLYGRLCASSSLASYRRLN